MQTQGLADKTMLYDGNGRLDSVELGGMPYQRFQYDDGRMSTKTTTAFGETEHDEMEYDDQGRLSRVRRNDLQIAHYAYQDENPNNTLTNPDLVYQFTDANGALATYDYTAEGWLKTIDIAGGLTIGYAYDEEGNLIHVDLSQAKVTFSDWDQGLPASMSWQFEGETVQDFIITKLTEGRIHSISGGDYALNLDWSATIDQEACADTPLDEFPHILGVSKAGPGYAETWVPSYNDRLELTGVTITPSIGSEIEESYGPVVNQLATQLTRRLDSQLILDLQKVLESSADERRVQQASDSYSGAVQSYAYDELGNLREVQTTSGQELQLQLAFTPTRRIASVTSLHPTSGVELDAYVYDHMGRRVSSSSSPQANSRRIYFYQGSQVIGLGIQFDNGTIRWTHAVGRGPLGPCMLLDIAGTGPSYFIFTDQLGTPFAWQDMETELTYYTPTNPWGELLSTPTSTASPYVNGNVSSSMPLPPVSSFDVPPLGLAGHIYDDQTGLVYMHHRFYSPRLGHFLTPDFRQPDIYDPSTFTEPYAYASANPIMFWDPDGLIGVFFDGTWNNQNDEDFGEPTNIAKLIDYYQGESAYVSGVGGGLIEEDWVLPEDLNNMDSDELRGYLLNQYNVPFLSKSFERIVGGYGGVGGKYREFVAYVWLVQTFNIQYQEYLANPNKADLEIDLFGFSRGAAEARDFANLLNEKGIPIYDNGDPYSGKEIGIFKPNIRMLGLFDTVSSFADPSNFDDDGFDFSTPPNVQFVRHAVAHHEYRSKFGLQTVRMPTGSEVSNQGIARTKEQYFIGSHSDVGGGIDTYPELAYLPLNWIRNESVNVGVPFAPITGPEANIPTVDFMMKNKHDSMDNWKYFDDRLRRRIAASSGLPFQRPVNHPNLIRWRPNRSATSRLTHLSNRQLMDYHRSFGRFQP